MSAKFAFACALLTWATEAARPAVRRVENEEHVGNEATMRVVRRAGSTWDTRDMKWSTDETTDTKLPEVYGDDSPRMYGFGRCAAYRAAVPFEKRSWGVAGLPNTGTHALFYSVLNNCQVPDHLQKGGWQVPWGKHELLHNWQKDAVSNQDNASNAYVMAIALMKDPLMWMASTCNRPYFKVAFDDRTSSTCPSPVSATRIQEYGQGHEDFKSLVHLWSKWGGEYMTATKPFSLMIRFEDFLFAPKATTRKVCDCLGFPMNPDFKVLVSDSKAYQGPQGHKFSNRATTLTKYSVKRNATLQRLTVADREYMRSILQQEGADGLAAYFHYDYSFSLEA